MLRDFTQYHTLRQALTDAQDRTSNRALSVNLEGGRCSIIHCHFKAGAAAVRVLAGPMPVQEAVDALGRLQ